MKKKSQTKKKDLQKGSAASGRKRGLNDKQRLFALEYLRDLNATQAAIRAGYSKKTAGVQGEALLKKPEIAALVAKGKAERAERTKITADRVLQELARVAFSNIKDFVTFDSDGIVRIKNSEDLTPEQAACIAEVTQVYTEKSSSFKFKLHDKLRALELVGKHVDVQAFKEKLEIAGDQDLIERLLRGRKRANGST